ncbi:MAG: cytochrome P450 [Pseudomonadales bacterium]|jgi:cytochrome P450
MVAGVADNLLQLWRAPLQLFERTAREQGDWGRINLGLKSLYLASHPDLVRELMLDRADDFSKGTPLERARIVLGDGLLTSPPGVHRTHRRRLQPAFQRNRVGQVVETSYDYALRVCGSWTDGQTVDVNATMMALAQRVIARNVLAVELSDTQVEAVSDALDTLVADFGWLLIPGSTLLWRSPLPGFRRMRQATNTLVALTREIVAQRVQHAHVETGDVLTILLAEPDQRSSGNGIVEDQVLTLLLAGHDTTGNGLAWCWLALSRHPRIEEEWHHELDTVLGDGPVTPTNLGRLSLTRRIVLEGLRLYPPAPAVGRTALRATHVGGHPIRKGDIVEVSPWVMHRDERYFAEPQVFDPERWAGDLEKRLPQGAFFPFGLGPRLCIGMHFALAIMTVSLAVIGQRWRLESLSAGPVPTIPRSITLRPTQGVKMRVRHRNAPDEDLG